MKTSTFHKNTIHKNPSEGTNVSQPPSPIAPEAQALDGASNALETRAIHVLDTHTLEKLEKTMIDAMDEEQVDVLEACLQKLSSATPEEIYRVVSQYQNMDTDNFLLQAIWSENLEILQLVLDFCKKLSQDKIQELFLKNKFLLEAINSKDLEIVQLVLGFCEEQIPDKIPELLLQKNKQGNCLLQAVWSDDSKILQLVLDFCKGRIPDKIQDLLLAKNGEGADCLLQATWAQDPEILPTIVELYTQFAPEYLNNSMQSGLDHSYRQQIDEIIIQINQRFTRTKNARKT